MMAPRPARFVRDDALEAALRIADESGIDELTMRRLGAALGVDPMAVYRHFSSKADITAALADRFWMTLELPAVVEEAGWRAYAVSLMRVIRHSLAAHPGLIPIVATHPIGSPGALAVADAAVGRLLAAGAPVEPSLVDLVNALVMLTVASALGEYSPPAGGEAEPAAEAPGGVIAELPHLGRLAAAGWSPSAERQFTAGVRALLDGWSFGG